MSVEEEVALVLHAAACGCNDGEPHDEPYATQAAALSPLLNRVRAEALREAARFLRDLHGEHESAETLEMYAREIQQNSEGNER